MCDERLKTNKSKIAEMPMSDGNAITIYSYDSNSEGDKHGMNTRFGPMAQEVQSLYPELVNETESGYLSVNMDGLLERAA